MPKCLGIYIEDDVIKYAKVDKTKDVLKVDASSIIFYEKENLFQTIERIIRETFSSKDPIAINISNELYNYFEVFSALKLADKRKSIDLDFELLCGEKGYNKESLDTRFILRDDKENSEKMKAIHIATNKENLRKRLQDFSGFKVVSATSISSSIMNLVDLPPREDNVIIVNIEKDTKITTVIGGEIYNVTVLSEGMGDILNSINTVENSMQKSYECCRNTTIYTQDSQELQTVDDNDHLEDVMPTLYKIVNETRKIVDSTITQISKVYVTGLGTSINNIDLYFQEYIPNAKCELLKPFFLENASIKIPIKEYIELNSAIALALEGLGYGNKELNFKGKSGAPDLNIDFSSAAMKKFFKGFTDWRKPLTAFDKMMMRLFCGVCVGIIGYIGISNAIVKQIDEKQTEVSTASSQVSAQISSISAQTSKINSAKTTYETLVSALTVKDDNNTSSSEDDSNQTDTTVTVIEKDSIPNLLNRIVYVIPKQVKITSIKNSEDKHIVIEAQADKYEQLGYFKAALTTSGYLQNVKSTSGSKADGVVKITIEGDLP